MRGIRRGLTQDNFGVRGQFDVARLAAPIGQGNAAHFRIILAHHRNSHRGEQRPVLARDLHAILVESRAVAVGFASARLITGRPYLAAAHVAQEYVAAPGVQGGIFAPAGERDVAPTAVAGAGGGHHHRVAAIGQEMSARCLLVSGVEAARGIYRHLSASSALLRSNTSRLKCSGEVANSGARKMFALSDWQSLV